MLQDGVAQKIVSALAVKLTEDEQERLERRYTHNLEAYDYFLRGLEYLYRYTEDANNQARSMFQRAIDLDLRFAAAYGHMSLTHWLEWSLGWTQDFQCLERAIALSPNYADAIAQLGHVLSFAGKPEEAIELVKTAMRLNPMYPVIYLWDLGHAYMLAGRYEEALAALTRVLNRNPNFHPAHIYLAITYGELGRAAQAQAEAGKFARMSSSMSWENWRQRLPYKDEAVVEHFFAVLRKAGVKPW